MIFQTPVTSARSDKTRLQKFMRATPVAVAAVGGATTASASVVYFDVSDTVVGVGATANFGSINLGAGSYDASTTSPSFGLGISTQSEKPRLLSNANVQFSHDSSAVFGLGLFQFTAGATIGSGATSWSVSPGYLDSPYTTPGNWPSVPAGYAGLRLVSGSDFNYGWASLIYNDAANTLTITGFAFESTVNTAITAGDVGAIPEPATSALLLAMGAGGLAVYRRRKASSALAA